MVTSARKTQSDSEGLHRELLRSLLQHYDLSIKRVEADWYVGCDQPFFRIYDDDGQAYTVHMRPLEQGIRREMRSHITWLRCLHRDTRLNVPEPIPMKKGRCVRLMRLPDLSRTYYCSIVTWVAGRTVAQCRAKPVWRQLGVAVAGLHDYGESFTPTPGFAIPTERGCCPGDARAWAQDVEPFLAALSGRQRPAFEAAAAYVVDALRRLVTPRKERCVTHGGLAACNATTGRGKVFIFDLQFITWGRPVYDIADWEYYELYQGQQFGHEPGPLTPALTKAFKDGYTSRRPWPEDRAQLNALIMRRAIERAQLHGFARKKEALKRTQQLLCRLQSTA